MIPYPLIWLDFDYMQESITLKNQEDAGDDISV
jgi:hypothetical protein